MRATWKPHEKHGELTMKSDLPDSVFAFPKKRKEPLTDARHVRNAVARLDQVTVEGKRRPCCFSVVPLDLHNALKAAPEAKATWSRLSSMGKRDFITWIEDASDRETRKRRIATVARSLAAGKDRVPGKPTHATG